MKPLNPDGLMALFNNKPNKQKPVKKSTVKVVKRKSK